MKFSTTSRNLFSNSVLVSALTVSILAMAPTAASAAGPIDVDVKSGRTTLIYRYSQYSSETCGSMAMPKFKVQSVQHGKISGTKGSFVLNKGHCKGKTVKGVAFKYTPNRGY